MKGNKERRSQQRSWEVSDEVWERMRPLMPLAIMQPSVCAGILMVRPEPTPEEPQHLCLDAGYDSHAE